MSGNMNDRLNAPVEPHDDGTVQEDPLYQEPSEGIVIASEPHVPRGSTSSDDETRTINRPESALGAVSI